MEMKPYAAFGYALMKTTLAEGDIMNDVYMKEGVINIEAIDADNHMLLKKKEFVWFVTKGQQIYTNLDTGDVKTLEPGWSSLEDPLTPGRQRLTVPGPTESMCMAEDSLPDLELVRMAGGESREFPHGTQLYLLEGELQIGSTSFPGMKQIRFSSGAKIAKATKPSFAVIFKV